MLSPEEIAAIGVQVALAARSTEGACVSELCKVAVKALADGPDLGRAVTASASVPGVIVGTIARHPYMSAPSVSKQVADALSRSAGRDASALGVSPDELAAALAPGHDPVTAADAVAANLKALAARDNLAMGEDARRTFVSAVSRWVPAASRGDMAYEECARRIVEECARRGVKVVDYASGRRTSIDVAARRHVVTQVQQAAASRSLAASASMGEGLVFVTSHVGARPSHREWQGKPFAAHGPLTVDGVTYQDLAEATGYGTPGGLCGANCVVEGTLVHGPEVAAAYRREYSGEVVTIRTRRNHEVTVTPNHPVLTTEGWVPAHLIHTGSHVFSACMPDGVPVGVGPYENDVPARIEDKFEALGDTFGVHTLLGSAADFHGDGVADGDVDVVLVDGGLVGDGEPHGGEQAPDDGLLGASWLARLGLAVRPSDEVGVGALLSPDGVVGGCTEGLSLVCRHARESRPHRGAPVLGGVSVLGESLAYDHVPRAHADRDFVLCHSGLVEPDDLGVVKLEPSPVGRKAELGEAVANDLPGDSELGCDGFERESFVVEPDEVVSVDVNPFLRGHVYNLQTRNGWYFANSIVTHNCRHSFGPWLHWQEPPYSRTPDEDAGLDPDEAYKATQAQRANEREIRAAKLEADALREAGQDDAAARLRLGRAQASQRKLLADHRWLKRRPERETAYGKDGRAVSVRPLSRKALTKDAVLDATEGVYRAAGVSRSRVERALSAAGFDASKATKADAERAVRLAVGGIAREDNAREAHDLIVSGEYPLSVRRHKQEEHIMGTEARASRLHRIENGKPVPSVVHMTADEAGSLIRRCSGTGVGRVYHHKDGSVTLKETCVHPDGAIIGTYVNGLDGMSTDTDSFIIHYSKKHGAHIVPARPSWEATGNARGA